MTLNDDFVFTPDLQDTTSAAFMQLRDDILPRIQAEFPPNVMITNLIFVEGSVECR